MCSLNPMSNVLCHASYQAKIHLTPDFKRDLLWLEFFLPAQNGISIFSHKAPHHVLELEAFLTGLGEGGGGGGGGRWHNMVYHLPVSKGYKC